MDIAERLHQLMLRPGFQAREDQQTLLDGKREIERLRRALEEIIQVGGQDLCRGIAAEAMRPSPEKA